MTGDDRRPGADGDNHADEPLMPLEEVQEQVLSHSQPLGRESLPIAECLGRFLAGEIHAGEDVPPFANSAMDGYAVRCADLAQPGTALKVVGVLAAGSPPPSRPLSRGEALQIMTGAAVPPGADAVVMVERTEPVSRGEVLVLDAVAEGANIRPAGSDFKRGDKAMPAGVRLGPVELAVLASLGLDEVEVWRRPKVGVMSTGDELVGAGRPLEPGQIRDSNRVMLLALLERDGFSTVDLGVVADTREAVRAALGRALAECDAVLSSGGVSKGEFDFVKEILRQLAEETGGESHELGVAIRPAKPLALAFLAHEGRPVTFFGLPGNPVSSLVSYQVIALPGLRKMAGSPRPLPRRLPAVAGDELSASRDGRLSLLRVEAAFGPDGRLVVRPSGGQQSHQLSGARSANGLAFVPPGARVAPGDSVEVLLTATPE